MAHAQVETTGLAVDTTKRNEVVAFWNRVYRASDGFAERMGWTGVYGTCQQGVTSPAFHGDVERRINFYRAMAGIEAACVVNDGTPVMIDVLDAHKPPSATTREQAAQRAALMFSYAGDTDHDPAPGAPFSCWTAAAWNAAARGNIALGLYGPDAIDAYMRENDPASLSSWSDTVKHRRWILQQGATRFASGDVPGHLSQFRPSNVLYVIHGSGDFAGYEPRHVAWPPPGCFPDELVPTQWSLGHPVASFAEASVQMWRADGSPLAVSLVDRTDRTGGGAIIWRVPAEAAAVSVDEDTTYRVRVQGIVLNGASHAYGYEVTVIDPDRLLDPLELEGTAQPPSRGATYRFDEVEAAQGYALSVSKAAPASWLEGAEDGTAGFIADGTGAGYDLRAAVADFRRTGSKAFRLAFPSLLDVSDQWFRIDREILPKAGARLEFYLRRGFMTAGTVLDVQTSADGLIWTTAASWAGAGTSWVDFGFVKREIPLPASETPLRVRFLLRWVPGTLVHSAGQSPQVGAFIDDIVVTNADWVVSRRDTPVDGGSLRCRLDAESAGESLSAGAVYRLRLHARVGGRDYPSPEVKHVVVGSPLAGFDLWMDADQPGVGGGFEDDHDGDGVPNGIEYAFHLNPADGRSSLSAVPAPESGSLRLAQPLPSPRADVTYSAEWSDDLASWSSADVAVAFAAGEMAATLPAGAGKRFVRWKITRP